MKRVTTLMLMLLVIAIPAAGEIRVIPNASGGSGAVAAVPATGSVVPVNGQNSAGKLQAILDSHGGKPFGTIRKNQRGDKKQQSTRALFRKGTNDTNKWY